METSFFILFFISILKLNLCFDVIARRDGDEEATEFPFAQAKVKYHRSRYCITAFGETNCVRMSEEPGNAAKIAKLYRIMERNYKEKSALRLGNDVKPGEQRENKLSQKISPNQVAQFMNQKVNEKSETQPKTMKQKETNKLRKKIKNVRVANRSKARQTGKLGKLITQTSKSHVVPVPRAARRGGYDKHGFLRLNYNPQRRSD